MPGLDGTPAKADDVKGVDTKVEGAGTNKGLERAPITSPTDNAIYARATTRVANETQSKEQTPAREAEQLAKDFAQDVSMQIRKSGIGSLQDVINKHTARLYKPDAVVSDVTDPVIPAISFQLQKDFKDIRVQANEIGFEFSKLDSKGRPTNKAAYYTRGTKLYEEKLGTDGKKTEYTRFDIEGNDGRTIAYVDKYYPGTDKRQSTTSYFKDGKTPFMKSIYEPGDSHEAKTSVNNPDGSLLGEINRDLFVMDRENLPANKQESKPFSVTLHGPNDVRVVNYDEQGFRDMYNAFCKSGTLPDSVSAYTNHLKQVIHRFANALPIKK